MPLSYSQLATYRRCPRQFEYANVKKISRPISPAESFGSSVHNALRRWGEHEMILSGKPVVSDQLTLFQDSHDPVAANAPLTLETLQGFWHASFSFAAYSTRMEADFARQRGEQLMHQFFTWWSLEPREVVAVEKGFSVEVDGELFAGRFDRLERTASGIRVVDYKTSSPRPQQEVDADLQLSLYALAVQQSLQETCSELILLFLGEERFIECETYRNQAQLEDARRQMHALRAGMIAGDFHPTPSAEKCRRCPYKNICDAAAVR